MKSPKTNGEVAKDVAQEEKGSTFSLQPLVAVKQAERALPGTNASMESVPKADKADTALGMRVVPVAFGGFCCL